MTDMEWRSINAFAARLTGTGYLGWFNLPIWQIRSALEYPEIAGPPMDCRLWVACEWIICSGRVIYKELEVSSDQALDEEMAKVAELGPLCKAKSPLSLERWSYWEARLLELSDHLCETLSRGTQDHVARAIHSMANIK